MDFAQFQISRTRPNTHSPNTFKPIEIHMKKTAYQSKEDFKKRQVLALQPQTSSQNQPNRPMDAADEKPPDSQEMQSPDLQKSRSQNPARWIVVSSIAIAVAAIAMGNNSSGKYTAHEWGTFTSVQGADGVLLDWRPLESSRLPQFVYNWKNAGLNRRTTSASYLNKAGMVTLQRMETPVIYFYSDQEESVDVSVAFPQGLITEWYPQACQIGPSTMPVPPAIEKLDEYAHKAGVKPDFTFASLFGDKTIKESRARWANVQLLPPKKNANLNRELLSDRSGSHYFAARDTDANFLRLSSLSPTHPAPEHEKFIFYRGVGSFATPLKVTMSSSDSVTIANSGTDTLSHLFVLDVKNGAGSFTYVNQLSPGQNQTVQISSQVNASQIQELSSDLGKHMATSLMKEGLYEREATAMVNTWKDSWFAEDGLRVLYVLPRSWTDRTLPLTLDPAPREVVRVMVGRAEVLSPEIEQKLSQSLARAHFGDEQARAEAISDLQKLGRFAEPALRLAIKGASSDSVDDAWSVFHKATTVTTDTTLTSANNL